MRRIVSLGAKFLRGVAILCAISCSPGSEFPDGVVLVDRLSAAAMALKNGNESRAHVEHRIQLNDSSLIVFVPSSGLVLNTLPSMTSDDLKTKLKDAVKEYLGQQVLAIVWSRGLSSGPLRERDYVVTQQLAVLKPGRGTLTVLLEKDSDGHVRILELK